MQQEMGIASVRFFGSYAQLLQFIRIEIHTEKENLILQNSSNNEDCSKNKNNGRSSDLIEDFEVLVLDFQLQSLLPGGLAVSQLLKCLPNAYKKDTSSFNLISKILLDLLSNFTKTNIGAYIAIHEWKIIPSLTVHLPPPLSGILELILIRINKEDRGPLIPRFHSVVEEDVW